MLSQLGSVDHGRPLVEQSDHRAQEPGLALSAFAEQHDVVTGDQGSLELRDDRGLEPVQARPGIAALSKRGEEIVADLDSKALTAKGKSKAELDAALPNIRSLRETVTTEYRSLELASALTWDDSKARVNKAIDDLKKAIDKVD
jgi:hypothetical protein